MIEGIKKFNKAIVTGGAGFIGSHIVQELLACGIEVVSIDDYSAGKEANLEQFASNVNLTHVKCDVTDYAGLKEHFEGIDVVFHNAASKKTICLHDPRRDLEVNAKGTFNVLELAREFGVKKVVHASSGSVYGEAQYYPQDEKHPLIPISYYGVSKLAGEKYAKVFHHLYGMDVSVLRYFHVYGSRQESADTIGGVVAIFARRILSGLPIIIFGDGMQQRSFTYVKDVVAANLLVAIDERATGEVFNCASGINITVKELADAIVRLVGNRGPEYIYEDWAPGDIKTFDIDNSKIRSLGFEFETSFEDGLRETVEWMQA